MSTIWDPPEGVGLHYGLDRISRRSLQSHFAAAMSASERCGVISERMDAEYQRLYGTNNVVLRHGILSGAVREVDREGDRSAVTIGFCGSLYAKSEWRAFLSALDELRWTVGGKPIRLVIAGSEVPYLGARHPAQVRVSRVEEHGGSY